MKFIALTVVLATVTLCGAQADAQTYYKCKDRAGNVDFSDRPCRGAVSAVISPKAGEGDSPERKAENDARIARDKALADQIESRRQANEQAGYASQSQQAQAGKALADKLAQERAQNAQPTSGNTYSPSISTSVSTSTAPAPPVMHVP